MKKLTFLLSLFALLLGLSPTASAQYTVMTSTDAVDGGDQAVRYEYYIYDWGGQTLHQLGLGVDDNAYYFNRDGNNPIKFIFKDNSYSEYDIYATNAIGNTDAALTYDATTYVLSVTNSNSSTLSVYLSTAGIIKKDNSNNGINIRTRISDGTYYEWQAVNTGTKLSTEKKSKDNSHTVGPFKNFYIKPASPAPMIFSNKAYYMGKYYATYSTGVAATIPDGVTAYTATYDATESRLTLAAVTGTTIPVNTGVFLALDESTTNTDITVNNNGKTVVYPTVSKETVDLGDTGFEASCTESNNTGPFTVADNTETETAYILGIGQSHGLGFYKLSSNREMDCYKAYLKVSSSTVENAIKIEFPGTTGIATATSSDKAGATIYDLSGRKVTKTSKGNVYIKNGKKILSK